MTPSRIFRLFVSSTFSDFIEEREWLRKEVFPKLEKYCAGKGASFQAVDLRWGITEAAQQNNETIQICLEEVRRCQDLSPRPNFAVLLGHRYGWEPIPEIIPEAHWGRLIAELSAQGGTGDIRTLNEFYQSDTNAAPPVYCLAPAVTDEQTSNIQRILRRAAAHFTGNDRLPYFGSATHQEIALGALGINDADEHVHAYIRRIKNLPNDARAKGYIDLKNNQQVPGANQRLNQLEIELRNRLSENHVHEFDSTWIKDANTDRPPITLDHLQSFGDSFYQHQVALINEELARIEKAESLQRKNEMHKAFAEERTQTFVGREEILSEIEDYLYSTSTSQSPFIAVAKGGNGKTSIIAKSYLRACKITAADKHPVVLCRFIGGVAGVETLKLMLESIITDIHTACGVEGTFAFQSVEETGIAFNDALKRAMPERPLWIFIDALDQLEQTDNLLLSDWLPETLPESVRIVLSTRPEALARSQGFTPHHIPAMKRQEGEELLSRWLDSSKEACFSAGITPTSSRTLTPEQRELVLEPFADHGNPLWLKLAYEEARRWRSWHRPNEELKALPQTVAGMVKKFVETFLIEQRKHPRVLVYKALSYLTAGRYGLSEEEIGQALGTDQEVQDEFKGLEKTDKKWSCGKSLPPIFWSRLAFDLKPYITTALIDGALVHRYFHREFTAAIEKNFLEGDQKSRLHGHLANNVFSTPDTRDLYQVPDDSNERPDDFEERQTSQVMRRLMEQPWQLFKAGQIKKLQTLLMDFPFCMAKCAANRAEDLMEDYLRAESIEHVGSREWQTWSGYILGGVGHLLFLGTSWSADRIFLQLAMEHAEKSRVARDARKWIEYHRPEWTCAYLNRSNKQFKTEMCIAVLSGHKAPIIRVVVLNDGRILSLSNDGDLRFWSSLGGKLKPLWNNLGPIEDLKKLQNGSILVRSREGTTRLWSPICEPLGRLDCHSEDTQQFKELSNERLLSWSEEPFLRIWSLEGKILAKLQGHSGPVEGADEISKGRILSWSKDKTIRLWSSTGQALAEFRGHTGSVHGARELSDDRYLSWSRDEKFLRLWSAVGEQLDTIDTGSGYACWSTQLSEGRVLVRCQDESRHLFSSSGLSLAKIQADSGGIHGIVEISEGRLLVWSADIENRHNDKGRVEIWSKTGVLLEVLENDRLRRCQGARQLSDGRLISWYADGIIKIWSSHGKLSTTWEGHSRTVGWVEELANGQLVSKSGDYTLKLWDSEGEHVGTLDGHQARITGFHVLPNSKILTWSEDQTLRIWDLSKAKPLKAPSNTIPNLSQCSDKLPVFWSRSGNSLELWSHKGDLLSTLQGHTHPVESVEAISKSKLMSGSFLERKVHLWSASGDLIASLEKRQSDFGRRKYHAMLSIKELKNGQLLSVEHEGEMRLWSPSGEQLALLEVHGASIVGVTEISGERLLSWSTDGTLALCSIQEKRVLRILNGHVGMVNGAYELRDGRLLSWSQDGTIRIWSPDSESVSVLVGHEQGRSINGALHLSDGRFVSWSYDSTIRLWSANGEALEVLTGHTASVSGVFEFGHGNLFSWSADNTVRTWSAQGSPLHCLKGHSGTINGALKLTGNRVLTWSEKEIVIWNLGPLNKESTLLTADKLHHVLSTEKGEVLALLGNYGKYSAPLRTSNIQKVMVPKKQKVTLNDANPILFRPRVSW